MTRPGYVLLRGSDRAELADAEVLRPVATDERIAATAVLRRRADLPAELVYGPETLTAQALGERHGADPADVDLLRETLTAAGLEVLDAHPGSRRVTFAGPASAMADVFGVELNLVRGDRRIRTGALQLPEALDGVVLAVLGLDDRPQAKPHFQAVEDAKKSYRPTDLAQVYKFPAETDGTGQTIAILELGGGFRPEELDTYFQSLGLQTPEVTAVSVDGGLNSPSGDPNSADGEVLLDIEVAGALAPKARQVVYFAPNTDQGFLDALSTAVHADPAPAAVSISWGAPEDQWTEQARTAFDAALADAAALGVTVTVASGDNGSSDAENDGKPHADFPASSPHALACGGTTLTDSSEVVWNNGSSGGATGGGVSAYFELPDFQRDAGVPQRADGKTGRGVPDVAADADPATGYQILVDGQSLVFGGTSAVAPLWAALLARFAQALGKPLGLVQTTLYGEAKAAFKDITSGDNGAYQAKAGWDPCTGLGAPDGEALLAALRGQ
ncbi:S8/S53 family peptidase [Amycolatopsis acidicola]|uniref:S8/S53 family peptidase n=1 Tax=Amycolatopsis acidicola TaxID=2596893 RepID=A0A5N0UIU0_9PSEU|nr:S53 family peptidase [Amycolatopsis acidicola]KAA9148803.1 S8/S53 family peptidase [Amycolatopsis acidicola]